MLNIKGFAIQSFQKNMDKEETAVVTYAILNEIPYKLCHRFEDVPEGYIPCGKVEWCEHFLPKERIVPNYFPDFLQDRLCRKVWRTDKWPLGQKVFIKPADRHKRYDGRFTTGTYSKKKSQQSLLPNASGVSGNTTGAGTTGGNTSYVSPTAPPAIPTPQPPTNAASPSTSASAFAAPHAATALHALAWDAATMGVNAFLQQQQPVTNTSTGGSSGNSGSGNSSGGGSGGSPNNTHYPTFLQHGASAQ